MSNDVVAAFPPLGLQIISEDVLLRLPSDEEIVALARRAYDNILGHGQEHFLRGNWTNWADANQAGAAMLRWHWAARASLNPESWRLVFFIFPLGDRNPVGAIDLRSDNFAATRTVTTGSWILHDQQNKGYGLAARKALLQFAFDYLGAHFAQSSAAADNQASNHISEKLGYQQVPDNDDRSPGRRQWLLRNDDFNDFVDLAVIGLDRCRPSLGLPIREKVGGGAPEEAKLGL